MCVVSLIAAPLITGLTVGVSSIAADVAIGLGVASMFQQNRATRTQAQAAQNAQEAQNRAIEYNVGRTQENARIEGYRADNAISRGGIEERKVRRRLSATLGSQRATFGASGVVVDEGSPLDVLAHTAQEGEQDALTVRHNAAVEAWGHQVQAQNFQNQAQLQGLQTVDPNVRKTTTLLGGRSKLLNQGTALASSSAGFFGV